MNARLRWLACLAALVASGQSAVQAEGHRPSEQTLADMGLGGLVVMSDDEAMAVRGMGFKGGKRSSVSVFGNSFATIDTPLGGAHSENGYTAEGKHFAKGANFSEAGVEIKLPGRGKGKGGKHFGGKGGKRWPGKGGSHFGKNFGKRWPGKGGMGGGHQGGGHKGGSTVKVRFFAGGHSFAIAR
jgi:hypothetical protein